MINMYNKKTSFVGDLIIIFIILLFVYFAYMIITPATISQIQEINKDYGVTEETLVPTNKNEYVTALLSINKEEALPIISFVQLDIEKEKLQKNIYQNLLLDCISADLYRKFDRYITNKNNLLTKFKNTSTKKHSYIYWDEYIKRLENNNVDDVYLRINQLERC